MFYSCGKKRKQNAAVTAYADNWHWDSAGVDSDTHARSGSARMTLQQAYKQTKLILLLSFAWSQVSCHAKGAWADRDLIKTSRCLVWDQNHWQQKLTKNRKGLCQCVEDSSTAIWRACSDFSGLSDCCCQILCGPENNWPLFYFYLLTYIGHMWSKTHTQKQLFFFLQKQSIPC